MAYYEPQGWQAPMRQTSWEPSAPPSRSGTSSTVQRDDSNAFASQFDEVDRALDNLAKSGKLFGGGFSRRDSMPMMGRPYDYGAIIPPRHSISDYENIRPHSASNLQGFYAAQRYQGRANDAEHMMQAKRRLAAQRERELRNYHQEQQYNRSILAEISTDKSDRSMSPAAMNEESRRDLIARQHRALYGHDAGALSPSGTLGDEPHNFRPENLQQGAKNASIAARGGSPRGVDPFLGQTHSQHGSENQPQTTSASAPSATAPVTRSPSNSISSPSNSNQTGYGMFDGQQQQTHGHNVPTATGNPESSSSMRGSSSNAPVGPIGSRPAQPSAGQAPNPALNKRSTTPLPSPLSYGFSPNDVNSSGLPNATASGDQGSASSTTNRPTPATSTSSSIKESSPTVGLSWGSGSGVWRSKNSLGVQASVWG